MGYEPMPKMTQSEYVTNICRDKLCKWVKPYANGHMDKILRLQAELRSISD